MSEIRIAIVGGNGIAVQPESGVPFISRIESGTEFGSINVEEWEYETNENVLIEGITLHQKGQSRVPDAITIHYTNIPNMVAELQKCYQQFIERNEVNT